jgi:hypothetical protein
VGGGGGGGGGGGFWRAGGAAARVVHSYTPDDWSRRFYLFICLKQKKMYDHFTPCNIQRLVTQ